MFVDRTLEYVKLLNKKIEIRSNLTVTEDLKRKINETDTAISNLKIMLERQCLPSFNKRKQRMEEINKKKIEVNMLIIQCEGVIKNIGKLDLCENMKKSIQECFATKIKRILIDYRNIQQCFLKKIEGLQVFDDLEENKTECNAMETMNAKKMCDIEQIRKSIFYLTTVLLEMKMIIGTQSWKIDRIDFFIGKANSQLKDANEEIREIPRKRNRIKNKIIYILSVSVMILITLSLLKAYRHRRVF